MGREIEKKIFFFATPLLIILLTTVFLESFRGNNDGFFANIPLALITKAYSFIYILYTIWYACTQKINWLQNLLIFSGTMLFTLVLLEWICGLALQKRPLQNYSGRMYSAVLDTNLGFKPTPNEIYRAEKIQNGQRLYSVIYHTDSNSMRITPAIDSSIKKTHYAQFFGCSYTWGEGLDSNQTGAYYFQEKAEFHKPYNFGFSAYGPHHMLAQLQAQLPKKIVKEPTGFAFYTYIDDHVNRCIGGVFSQINYEGKSPNFVMKNGKLVRDGLFKDRFFTTIFLKTILNSNICKLFNIGYPFKLTDEHYEFTADIIAEASKTYKTHFGNDNFYVIIYPTENGNSDIIKYLKARNINYLDYSKLFNPKQNQYMIPVDTHPSALANKIIVQQLHEDLKITD